MSIPEVSAPRTGGVVEGFSKNVNKVVVRRRLAEQICLCGATMSAWLKKRGGWTRKHISQFFSAVTPVCAAEK
jgi:hypothetical protein